MILGQATHSTKPVNSVNLVPQVAQVQQVQQGFQVLHQKHSRLTSRQSATKPTPTPTTFSSQFSYKKLGLFLLFNLLTIGGLKAQHQNINVAPTHTETANLYSKRDTLAYLYRTLIATPKGVAHGVLITRDAKTQLLLYRSEVEETNEAEFIEEVGSNYARPIKVEVISYYPPLITEALENFAKELEEHFNQNASFSEEDTRQEFKTTTHPQGLARQLRENIIKLITQTDYTPLSKKHLPNLYNALNNYCELITLEWHITEKDNIQTVTLKAVPASKDWVNRIGRLKVRGNEQRL